MVTSIYHKGLLPCNETTVSIIKSQAARMLRSNAAGIGYKVFQILAMIVIEMVHETHRSYQCRS